MSLTCLRAAFVPFALQLEKEKAGRREAEARLKGADAKFANLTTGRRAPEVEAVRAQEAQAKAARGIRLKGNGLAELWPNVWPILAFTVAVIRLGSGVYRKALD